MKCTDKELAAVLPKRVVRQNIDVDTLLQLDECTEALEPEHLEELQKTKASQNSGKSERDSYAKSWRMQYIFQCVVDWVVGCGLSP